MLNIFLSSGVIYHYHHFIWIRFLWQRRRCRSFAPWSHCLFVTFFKEVDCAIFLSSTIYARAVGFGRILSSSLVATATVKIATFFPSLSSPSSWGEKFFLSLSVLKKKIAFEISHSRCFSEKGTSMKVSHSNFRATPTFLPFFIIIL